MWKLLYTIAFSAVVSCGFSQNTGIPLWGKENWFLNRLEIKAGTHPLLNNTTVKPYMRSVIVPVADSFRTLLLSGHNPAGLSQTDKYNLDRLIVNNNEFSRYSSDTIQAWRSAKKVLGFFWPTKGNMVEVQEKDFYLVVNPLMNVQQSFESGYGERVFVFSRGIAARGLIAKKIGFDFYTTENQERGPLQYRQFFDSNRVVPGVGQSKNWNTGFARDYFDARGNVSWSISKHVNMQFGYDQHFIGNGYRSLFLGNSVGQNLYLKVNTRVGRFNYTNIFSELFVPNQPAGDVLNHKQYAATHYLGIQATSWLTLGLFETVVFGEMNRFHVSQLQPVMFLNTLFRNKEANSNAFIGLDAKANFLKKVQVYGQWIMQGYNRNDGFNKKEDWGNRFGFQAGAKYVDAIGIKNLDLQAEINQVRPFMYSSPENAGSWTNYRLPMAHPFGANFREILSTLRYQPVPKLYVSARAIYWKQGRDSARFNFGSNPRYDNSITGEGGRRIRNGSYPMFAGTRAQGFNSAINVSYELFENMFLEAGYMYRYYKNSRSLLSDNTDIVTFGFRWNMFRRDYDF